MNLKEKSVLITGASSGIGAATAREFARQGAQLILLARNESNLASVADEVEKIGASASFYSVDLSDSEATEAVITKIQKEQGTPDVLINNAGAGIWKPIDETSIEEAKSMMAVPYFAAFHLTRLFLPEMLKRNNGHIINMTSAAAYIPVPGSMAYSVARWAMRSFNETLRADLKGSGVKATLIAPGKVSSPYFANNPGTEENIPKIATLPVIYPTLTEEQVALSIVRVIGKNKKEVIIPFNLGVTVRLRSIFPWMVDWLIASTGWKRARHQ